MSVADLDAVPRNAEMAAAHAAILKNPPIGSDDDAQEIDLSEVRAGAQDVHRAVDVTQHSLSPAVLLPFTEWAEKSH